MNISAKDIITLSINHEQVKIKYIDPDTPQGVLKFSKLVCHPREVEFICPYEVIEEYRDITGNLSRTVFCTKECPHDS